MCNLYIDTHTHLWDERYDRDRDSVIDSLRVEGIDWIIEVGVDLQTSQKALALAEKRDNVFASVGMHPHDIKKADNCSFEILQSLATHPKCVAIGEIGLDFYRNLSPQEMQREWFKKQIEWALDARKPIILHIRDAYQEALDILLAYRPFPKYGVVHCFQSDIETAERFIDLGFYIGLGGPVTYDTATKQSPVSSFAETIALLPDNRILSETDCPYLSPVPFRGKRNEPRNVKFVVSKISEIKNHNVDAFAKVLKHNAERVFGVPQ
jgi:TatD DNase family protein